MDRDEGVVIDNNTRLKEFKIKSTRRIVRHFVYKNNGKVIPIMMVPFDT